MATAVMVFLCVTLVLVGLPLACRPHLRPDLSRSPWATVIILGLPALACLLAVLWSLP